MKATFAKRQVVFGIAALAAGLTASLASAATIDDEIKTVVVRYSDLDLSQPSDAQRLYVRIKNAARVACGDVGPEQLERRASFEACMSQAITDAVQHVGAVRVTELHQADIQHAFRS
jgi:UrcA family protein